MTSILAENRYGAPSGALVVRDADGNRTIPSPVYGPSVYTPPAGFTISNGLETALPQDCGSRIDPNQINAIVSELLAFMVALRPSGTFDRNAVTNLAGLWAAWKSGTDTGSLGEILAAYATINSPHLTGTPTTPNQSSGANNTTIANTAYVDAAVALLAAVVSGALVFKGAWDASGGTFPGTAGRKTGWFYKVSVAGTVGGVSFSAGDDLYAVVDTASTTVYAANWLKIEGSITSAEVVAALGFTPQVASAILTAFAALTLAADKVVYATGAGALATTDLTSVGRTLIGSASFAAMRASGVLNVESYTSHGDSVYTILATDRVVGTSATLTAPRVWTLPAASALNPGQSILVSDFFGGASATNTLTLARAGSDTMNGATSAVITTAYGAYLLTSDGVSKWSAQSVGAASTSGVATVFSRSGTVAAQADDYSAFVGLSIALNLKIVASVAANALTIAIKDAIGSNASAASPVVIPFRDATLANGGAIIRKVTAALSIVVPASQAIGTVNSTPSRLWLLAIDNAGTVELALVNCLLGGASPTGIYPLNEQTLLTTTAIATAPSAAVPYSTTARTSLPFRILGYVEYASGLATAGTWSAAPDIVQMFGPGMKKPGDEVQRVWSPTGASATGSTTIPYDDTIPQNTEGFQVMSASISPTSGANLLGIETKVQFAQDSGSGEIVSSALFRDAIANALIATHAYNGAAGNWENFFVLRHLAQASSSASATFKTRLGSWAGTVVTFNGRAGGRKFGGVDNSYIEIREIQA